VAVVGENEDSCDTDTFVSLVDELGEGFSGDELDEQLGKVDTEGTGSLKRAAFLEWYRDLIENDDDESDADSDIAEERENAETAYDDVASGKGGVVEKGDFEQLFEALGSTYDASDHGRYVDECLGDDGKVSRTKFASWYVDWLFGDNESDIGSDEEEEEEDTAGGSSAGADAGGESSGAGSMGGWGNTFKKSGWKCETCMSVGIPEDKFECPACEAVRPGFEEEAKAAKAKPAAASGGSSGGGFTFGAAPASSGFTFGAPAATSAAAPSSAPAAATGGGFTFGAPASGTAAAPAPSPAPTASTGGFTFGAPAAPAPAPAPTPAPAPASAASSGGGFTFGAPAAASSHSPASGAAVTSSPTGFSFGYGPKPSSPSLSPSASFAGFSFVSAPRLPARSFVTDPFQVPVALHDAAKVAYDAQEYTQHYRETHTVEDSDDDNEID